MTKLGKPCARPSSPAELPPEMGGHTAGILASAPAPPAASASHARAYIYFLIQGILQGRAVVRTPGPERAAEAALTLTDQPRGPGTQAPW